MVGGVFVSSGNMERRSAKALADGFLRDLQGYCERIEIAGSIRRGKEMVGDIEIVAMPRLGADLFGEVNGGFCALDGALDGMAQSGYLGKAIKSGLRYKQYELPQGIKLDLFIVRPPAQWGVIFAIRTGPWKFSRWIVTRRDSGGALPSDCTVSGGAVYRGGKVVPMAKEIDFFNFIGLDWVSPEKRFK